MSEDITVSSRHRSMKQIRQIAQVCCSGRCRANAHLPSRIYLQAYSSHYPCYSWDLTSVNQYVEMYKALLTTRDN